MDGILCLASVIIAFYLRLGDFAIWSTGIQIVMLITIVLWPVIFTFSGVYRAIFRYAGAGMMVGMSRSMVIYAFCMVCIVLVLSTPQVPRTIALIHPIVFFLMLVISRITARYILVDLLNQRGFEGATRNILIYGAGEAGQLLARSLRNEPSMMLCGYVDDDKRLNGQTMDGVKIHHASHLPLLIPKKSVDEILLALPMISRAKRKRIVDGLQSFPVRVQTLPNMNEIVSGKITVSDLREIQIEDLLGRDPVPPNQLLMGKTIVGKTVIVTGAGGSIGSELCRQILRARPAKLILFEMTEFALYKIDQELRKIALNENFPGTEIIPEMGTVIEKASLERLFSNYKPDTVFHAAAYKHVPLVEANPLAGLRNNIFGTLYLAQVASEHKVSHCILISTDKAVRPTNIMGASKRVAELVMQALAKKYGSKNTVHTRFAMVRFGNVLGSSGSVVPLFKEQIRNGLPVTLTDGNVTRYFMTIPEAAQLVIQAGAMAEGGEVFVLDMGKPVRIQDLAVSMIRLSGLSVRDAANPDGDIEIVETGLRPGEKLYEELLIGDNPLPTKHKRIMKADEKMLPYDDLMQHLNNLDGTIQQGNVASAVAILSTLVPEYQPVRLASVEALQDAEPEVQSAS